jgi:hypothetical protein
MLWSKQPSIPFIFSTKGGAERQIFCRVMQIFDKTMNKSKRAINKNVHCRHPFHPSVGREEKEDFYVSSTGEMRQYHE